jgi:hypothetical protein
MPHISGDHHGSVRNTTSPPKWPAWVGDFLRLILVIALMPAADCFAQGGPPMLTDDPSTPGAGNWEINTAYLEQRTRQQHFRSFPHIDVNYGLGENIQLKYETGWLFLDTKGDGHGWQSGLDDSLLGVKWRFLDQERAGVDVSVYPQLQLESPTDAVSRGIAEPGPNLLLPFEVGHDFGKVKVVTEVGYQYFHDAKDEWVAGLLGAFQLSEKVEVMAEARLFTERPFDFSDVILNAGFRAKLGEHMKLLGAMGFGPNNSPDATRFFAYLGIQVLLGKQQR